MLKRIGVILIFSFIISNVYSLTGGCGHIDYYGYVSGENQDMVDFKTGDFSYSIPLLEVPGPSFPYKLHLGYNAGIQLEQQASWVGLGWNMHCGAINRTLNRFPDDYLGGKQISIVEGEKSAYDYDLSIGISVIGYNHHWGDMGGEYSMITLLGQPYWGWGDLPEGAMNVNMMLAAWAGIKFIAEIAISEAGTYSKPEYDPSQAYEELVSIRKILMGQKKQLSGFGLKLVKGIKSIGMSALQQTALWAATSFWGSSTVKSGMINSQTDYTSPWTAETRTWIYQKETNSLYGYLYLGRFPEESIENKTCNFNYHRECPEDYLVGSDDEEPQKKCAGKNAEDWDTRANKMEFDWVEEERKYFFSDYWNALDQLFNNNNPRSSYSVTTQDAYQVSGPGIGLSFRPYRQDIGDYYEVASSISGHIKGNAEVTMEVVSCILDPIAYLIQRITGCHPQDIHVDIVHGYDAIMGEYATKFVDEYDENSTDEDLYGGEYPITVFKPAAEAGGTFNPEEWPEPCACEGNPGRDCDQYCLPGSDCYPPDSPPPLNVYDHFWEENNAFQKAQKARYISKKLNDPLSENTPRIEGFDDRIASAFGIFPIFQEKDTVVNGPTIKKGSLTGFIVIKPDGMRYEYTLPVYNFYIKSFGVDRPEWEEEKFYKFGGIKSEESLYDPFAYSWLLTCVKSSDYVDVDGNNKPNKGDFGGWVRFVYNKHIERYHWRKPYYGFLPTGMGKDIPVNVQNKNVFNFKSFGNATEGIREIYYLTDIFTETHHAKINLADRNDAIESKTEGCVSAFYHDRTKNPDLLYVTQGRADVFNRLGAQIGDRMQVDIYLRPEDGQDNIRKHIMVLGTCKKIDVEWDGGSGSIDAKRYYYELDNLDFLKNSSQDIDCSSGMIYCDKNMNTVKVVANVNSSGVLQKVTDITLSTNNNDDCTIDDDETVCKVIKFRYADDPGFTGNPKLKHELCPGTPNSTTPEMGKLTLRQILIGDGKTFLPPYEFHYYMEGDEAPYHRLHWDRYGFYKHDGGLEKSDFTFQSIINGDSWLNELKSSNTDYLINEMIQDTLNYYYSYDVSAETKDWSELDILHKTWILNALNRIKNNVEFYKYVYDTPELVHMTMDDITDYNDLLMGIVEDWDDFFGKVNLYQETRESEVLIKEEKDEILAQIPLIYGIVGDKLKEISEDYKDQYVGTGTPPDIYTRIIGRTDADELTDDDKSWLLIALDYSRREIFANYKYEQIMQYKFKALAGVVKDFFQKLREGIDGLSQIFTNVDGTIKNEELTPEERNMVELFNAALLSLGYLKMDKGYVRKKIRNRFDHDTDPDDVIAWSLKKIIAPTESEILIEYESDDYSYVSRTRDLKGDNLLMESGDLTNTAVYKNVGKEKSFLSLTDNFNMANLVQTLGENYLERADDITLRVESVFRLYKKVTMVDGEKVVFNSDFDTLRRRKIEPKDPSYASEEKLHLIAWIAPKWLTQGIGSDDLMISLHPSMDPYSNAYDKAGCGATDVYTQTVGEACLPNLIPVDLGEVALEFEYHNMNNFNNDDELQDVPEEKFCQRNYVEFKLSDLSPENWQGNTFNGKSGYFWWDNWNSGCDQCALSGDALESVKDIDYIKMVHHFSWARKRSIWAEPCLDDDWPCYDDEYGWMEDDGWVIGKFPDGRFISRKNDNCGSSDNKQWCRQTYIEDPHAWHDEKIRVGHGAWVSMEELRPRTIDLVKKPEEEDGRLQKRYWDFYKFNIYLKTADQLVNEAAGTPGGGLRTKRITLNSGWVKKKKNPTDLKIIEFAYDNAEGFGGTYSSGSIGSVPPPYSNAGDDRWELPSDVELLQGQHKVYYRTVAQISPGKGRKVYHFMTPADIGDYFTAAPNEFSQYNDPENDKVYDHYGINWLEPGYEFMYLQNPNKRFQLHRLNHIHGSLRKIVEYDNYGKLISEQRFKYVVSMDQLQINDISMLSAINNSDANGAVECLLPGLRAITDDEEFKPFELYSGDKEHKFTPKTEMIDKFGRAVQRYRHRRSYTKSLANSDYKSVSGGNDPRWATAITEFEEIEHGFKLYQVENITYDANDRKKKLVNRNTNEYFDFITGAPILIRDEEIREEAEERCATCDNKGYTEPGDATGETVPAKVAVTVPAHWIDEYNNSGLDVSMGSVFKDPNYREAAIGFGKEKTVDDLKYKNLLTQGFSKSVYSELDPYRDMVDEQLPLWLKQLNNEENSSAGYKPLYQRQLTTWGLYTMKDKDDNEYKTWRISGDYIMTLPMTNNKEIDVNHIFINYPFVRSGTVQTEFLDVLSENVPVYIPQQRNEIYDNWGNALETRNANGQYAVHVYDKGIYEIAQVINARAGKCQALTFDDIDDPNELKKLGWELNGNVIISSNARSGSQGIKLVHQTKGFLLIETENLLEKDRKYELSFWISVPHSQLKVNGEVIFKDDKGPRWKKMTFPINLVDNKELSILSDCKVADGEDNFIDIDDLRIAPVDAQVTTWTYNDRGWMTSTEGPEGLITCVDYDAHGNAIANRDHEGVIYENSDQVKSKRD